MEKTNKSLKEWNAIVEALGQGIQSIIIRKNPTHAKGFLLYPTFSYTLKEDFLNNFKEEFQEFVKENALPHKKAGKTEIKYFAKVEKVIEKSPSQISSFDKYHVWETSHVKDYLGQKKGYIWLLRIFKLEKPYMAEPNHSMKFVNLHEQVSLKNAVEVIDDIKYLKYSKSVG